MIWQEPPSVALLQWLARGSLKQNLLQAVRLWVWLNLLYGKPGVRLELPDPFRYADWRSLFFTKSHPATDDSPLLHDADCPCTRGAAAWLLDPNLNPAIAPKQAGDSAAWKQEYLDGFERELQIYKVAPPNLAELLEKTRLFTVTGRTFRNDLRILADELHCLRSVEQKYTRVNEFPDYPKRGTIWHRPLSFPQGEDGLERGADFLTQPDLAAIAYNLSQRLNDYQRFFVHVEYVVSGQQLDAVDEWQAQLRDGWQQTPVLPIQLRYASVRLQHSWEGTVFPVCIYYYQRGPYLCAFGQYPDAPDDRLDWRNYRLDRITALNSIAWDDVKVPPLLRLRYQQNKLPTPDEIELRMDEAWGFDYYQPIQQVIVRFDRTWDDRYIRNSFRHKTFKPIAYDEVGATIQRTLRGKGQRHLLQVWRSRSDQDAYYQVNVRENDPNVWQRLRAWRPHIEVILPWSLRQQFAEEVDREWHLYQGGKKL